MSETGRVPSVGTYNGHMVECWQRGCRYDVIRCRKANRCVIPATENGNPETTPAST